jgi:hypothetical protein
MQLDPVIENGTPILAAPFRQPFAPMGGMDINVGFGLSIYPPVLRPPAGKDKRMYALVVNNGQFEIAVERSGANNLPHGPIKRPACLKCALIWIIPRQIF